jgi:arginine N-succinyltransferase
MFVVRPAGMQDLDGLLTLAKKTGTGLTTLPNNRDALTKKIQDSVDAFAAAEDITAKYSYLLVLEDPKTGVIAGTSALIVGVGLDKPFYSYRILHQTQVCHDPEMRVDTELLQLSNDFTGATEVATLFLDPDYRIGNLGKLLSKARYMLMAAHPKRFSDRVISEIRGWIDEDGNSPFWEAIGRHFFGMDFKTADEINGLGNSQFIADMMPKFPIYTALLADSAREVIGKPHDSARPAIRLLEKEGFRFSGSVDIFDGGPAMEVHRRGIWSVRKSADGTLGGTVEGEGHDPLHLACTPSPDNFGVVQTNVVEGASGVWLPQEAATALDLNTGDQVRFGPLERERS